MKKMLLLLFFIFFLYSCENGEELWKEKKDFFIEVQKYDDFSSVHQIQKSGKISSEQSIALSSKVSGQVSSIAVKPGEEVKKWQSLIYIADTIINYSNSLNGASLGIESAKINYETQKINLEKAVADTKLNLDRLQKNFEISKKQIENDMKSAKINFENSNLSWSGSSSSLQLQKLEESIAKAEFDYENLLISNKQQLDSLTANARNEYDSLLNLYTDIIDFGDKILWITTKNRRENDDFEDYLGSSNQIALGESKTLFREMQENQETLRDIKVSEITPDNVLEFLWEFKDGHDILSLFLQKLEETLIGSIDASSFPKSTFLSQVNGYQAQVQWWKAQFTATNNATTTFLNTYKLSEESSKKQIDLLYTDLEITKKSLWDGEEIGEISYNKTILALEDQLIALETNLESARLTHENAKKQLDVTLRALNNQIKTAQNWYSTALKEYQKLTITSPIDGVIWSISVQEWQEISQGNPLLNISNTQKWEIKVFFSQDEVWLVKEWQEVFLDFWDATIKAELVSVSKIANSVLNYEGSIIFDEDIELIWNVIDVKIPVTIPNKLIPVLLVETLWKWKWQIKTFSGSQIENKIIEMWNIWGNNIEVLSGLNGDENIILSEIQNFDSEKYALKLKTEEGGTQ